MGDYCDGCIYPDGSYEHTVSAMGFWQSSSVCPPDPGRRAAAVTPLYEGDPGYRRISIATTTASHASSR